MRSTETLVGMLVSFDELRRTDERHAISRVASIIGHLVGTPLNVIAGRTALIRANAHDAQAVLDDVARIERQVEQLTNRLRAMIEFLSVPDGPGGTLTAGALLSEALELYQPIAETRGLALERGDTSADSARVDRNVLFGVFTSLLSLASHELRPGARITLGGSRAQTGGTASLQRPDGYVRFSLLAPGLNAHSPQKLDKVELSDRGASSSLHQRQVLSVCSALADRAGGRLDIAGQGESAEIFLLWPCLP